MGKNPPAMQETWVRSLGQEDPLEEEMKTPSSILAWEIPWTEEPGGLQSTGSQRVRQDWGQHSTARSDYHTGQHRSWQGGENGKSTGGRKKKPKVTNTNFLSQNCNLLLCYFITYNTKNALTTTKDIYQLQLVFMKMK